MLKSRQRVLENLQYVGELVLNYRFQSIVLLANTLYVAGFTCSAVSHSTGPMADKHRPGEEHIYTRNGRNDEICCMLVCVCAYVHACVCVCVCVCARVYM